MPIQKSGLSSLIRHCDANRLLRRFCRFFKTHFIFIAEQRIYPLYLPHLNMDAEMSDTENKTSPAAPEKQLSENKTRGRGAKLRGRGGRGGMRSGMRGGRGMIKAFGHPGHVRGPMYDGPFNGFPPMRGMGRMRPYPDPSGHRGRGLMGPPRPPPPPMHLRGPFPPMHRHGPPFGHPAFRGRPPHPRGRGVPLPPPPRPFFPRGPRGRHTTQYSPHSPGARTVLRADSVER